MNDLDGYVGRIVRLNGDALQTVARRAQRQGVALENCFVVASVSYEVSKLICYGANFRVAVGISEVALI
ncbi:MAG: hypothetical protein HZC24_16235 [Rhodocyclales bacterium]|nr:hypothetical protein [Rhodocyclales bacterium]